MRGKSITGYVTEIHLSAPIGAQEGLPFQVTASVRNYALAPAEIKTHVYAVGASGTEYPMIDKTETFPAQSRVYYTHDFTMPNEDIVIYGVAYVYYNGEWVKDDADEKKVKVNANDISIVPIIVIAGVALAVGVISYKMTWGRVGKALERR